MLEPAIDDSNRKFSNKNHTIFWGDAINVLKESIESESIDLIFCDPPYNIGKKFSNFHDKWPSDEAYAEWSYQWLDECIRILKSTGSMYIMTSTQAMPYFDLYLRQKLTIQSRIVWHYDSSGVQARKFFGSLYEPILHCVKDARNHTFNASDIEVEAKTGAKRKLIDYRKAIPTRYNTKKVPGNVWYFPRVRYRMDEYENHPSQKPESLLERIILASSNPNDVILDPFAGTFTTGAVAKKLARKSVCIECEEEYFKIGLRRVLGENEYKGEKLTPVEKSYKRKNGKHKKEASSELTRDLFDVER